MGNAITIIGNGRSYVGSFNQWGGLGALFSCSNGHFIDSKGAITIGHILISCFLYFQCQYEPVLSRESMCPVKPQEGAAQHYLYLFWCSKSSSISLTHRHIQQQHNGWQYLQQSDHHLRDIIVTVRVRSPCAPDLKTTIFCKIEIKIRKSLTKWSSSWWPCAALINPFLPFLPDFLPSPLASFDNITVIFIFFIDDDANNKKRYSWNKNFTFQDNITMKRDYKHWHHIKSHRHRPY